MINIFLNLNLVITGEEAAQSLKNKYVCAGVLIPAHKVQRLNPAPTFLPV